MKEWIVIALIILGLMIGIRLLSKLFEPKSCEPIIINCKPVKQQINADTTDIWGLKL